MLMTSIAEPLQPASAESLVDVIIPCFNAEDTLARAVLSARANKCINRVIVVDDGSSDGSCEVAALLPVELIREENRGACTARNIGLKRSNAEFVIFLDADDHLDPGYIDHLVNYGANKVDAIVGSHRERNGSGIVVKTVSHSTDAGRDAFIASYLKDPLQTAAIMWRRSYLLDIGGWDEDLPVLQDMELMFRAFAQNASFATAASSPLAVNWEAGDKPTRISNYLTAAKASGKIRPYALHGNLIASAGPMTRLAVQHRVYRLAREAFEGGYDAAGREALKLARALGLHGHRGDWLHRIACSVLGLRQKTRLKRLLKRRSLRKE
jgi:glycosyltransferase involved in cell wall biosynthesis